MGKQLTLYFAPGACSLAPHIALREADMQFELEKVILREMKTGSGGDYVNINPLGYVPALRLLDDSILTEVSAILLYIADQKPDKRLAPEPKTADRYQLYRWLTFVSSEIHKGFGLLFNPAIPDDQKNAAMSRLLKRFAFVNTHLSGREWLVNDLYSVADIYAFVCIRWSDHMKIDMGEYPHLQKFLARVAERKAVGESLRAEQQT